jgi:hypothetical protein
MKYSLAPNSAFDVDIDDTFDPGIPDPNIYRGGSQDSGLDQWDQEGWLEQSALVSQGVVAKWVKYPTGYSAQHSIKYKWHSAKCHSIHGVIKQSVIYVRCHLCWVSQVLYAECCYAEYHGTVLPLLAKTEWKLVRLYLATGMTLSSSYVTFFIVRASIK